jgi:threonine/homoserine/homoserine lactone efflux protein
VVLIVIPGPDFAVVTKNTLVGGHRRGRWTALGVSSSNLVQGTAAAFGLSGTAQNMAGWRQGFISNVTNPKVLVFYLAVPQQRRHRARHDPDYTFRQPGTHAPSVT